MKSVYVYDGEKIWEQYNSCIKAWERWEKKQKTKKMLKDFFEDKENKPLQSNGTGHLASNQEAEVRLLLGVYE